MAINVTKSTFQSEVLEAKETVIVDFWATWCGPCKMIAPILEEIGKENIDIKICKVNVDDEEELSVQFNVMSIPTLLIYKAGQVVNKIVGYRPKEDILKLCK